jgi:hypothetical protein
MPTIGSHSHLIEFTYPVSGGHRTLNVRSGMDEIEWGYNLNVARYPTFAGEVVQILSCYVDNLTIRGSLQKTADLEDLYDFFLGYIARASQGAGGTRYSQDTMTMHYGERGWKFNIVPISLPAFRLGRDVVIPEWRVEAFVNDYDDQDQLKDLIIAEAQIKEKLQSSSNLDTSFNIKGQIIFKGKNPFSDPQDSVDGPYSPALERRAKELSDFYTSLLPTYLKGDFSALLGDQSKPAFLKDIKVPKTTRAK